MSDIDTSAEAVKLVLGYLRGPRGRGKGARIHYDILDEIVPQVLGLLAERDKMRDEYTYIGKDGKSVLARDLEAERDTLRAELALIQEAAEEDMSGSMVNHYARKLRVIASMSRNALKTNGGNENG